MRPLPAFAHEAGSKLLSSVQSEGQWQLLQKHLQGTLEQLASRRFCAALTSLSKSSASDIQGKVFCTRSMQYLRRTWSFSATLSHICTIHYQAPTSGQRSRIPFHSSSLNIHDVLGFSNDITSPAVIAKSRSEPECKAASNLNFLFHCSAYA